MSKKQRNILILGFIGLISCYICSLVFIGTGSPFESGGFWSSLGGFDVKQMLFGDDTLVRMSQLDTDCLLDDNTLEFDGDCDIDIEGDDEPPDFDTPRDLRLTMCWGAILVNVDSENITVEDSPLPTEKISETLTINVFRNGDTEIELSCETDTCRIALNDNPCPRQTQISLNQIGRNCTITNEGFLEFRGACSLSVDSNESGDEENPDTLAFEHDEIPRVLPFYHCVGEVGLTVSSDEDLMPSYSLTMPEQANRWNVDIYGEDISNIAVFCSPTADNTACLLRLWEANCSP